MFETPDDDVTPLARAYVYSGEWVADCPRREEGTRDTDHRMIQCGNVEFLYQPQQMNGPRVLKRPFFLCSNCGMQAMIDWPDNEHDILQALSVRPVPQTRNWYPQDHPVAVNFRIPHGQTVGELMDENEEHGVR
jgi:hypothetical protein